MTANRDPWLLCDGCGSQQYPDDAGESAFINSTIRELRRAAKADGWRFTRDGRDLCPDCNKQADGAS